MHNKGSKEAEDSEDHYKMGGVSARGMLADDQDSDKLDDLDDLYG